MCIRDSTLRYLAGGREELEEALPVDPSRLMATGLFASLAAAIVPMFFGRPPLASAYGSLDIPLIGSVSFPSALVFDVGVYLIVIGLILFILFSLGGKLDEEEEVRKQRARDRARSLARRQRQRENAKNKKAAAARAQPAKAAAHHQSTANDITNRSTGKEK